MMFLLIYVFPERCLGYELIQVTDECLVSSSQHVIGIFFVHGPSRWLPIWCGTWNRHWNGSGVSLLIPTISVSIRSIVLRITHAVDRILGDRDPVTLPLGGSTASATHAHAGSGTT